MRAYVLAMSLVMLGCGPASDTDSDVPPSDDTDDEGDFGCDQVSLFVDGPARPRVGDSWTVTMRCDGATLTGPLIVRVEPLELATLQENTLTFATAGEGTVRAQSGSLRTEEPVTVRP